MKNEKIMNAMGKISDELIEDAVITTEKKTHTAVWVRWAAMAACLCLVICGLFMMQNSTPMPSATGDNPSVVDPVFRGPTDGTTAPNQSGEKINVYKIASLNLNISDMLAKLDLAGWERAECTILGEHSFYLKGTLNETCNELDTEVCKELAKAFMEDSGLVVQLGKYGVVDYAYETTIADGLVVTYCYFMCEGERTGAYIRLIFEDYKHIGEVQAHVYSSTCIDHLTLLSLNDALKTAYKKNSAGKLEEINADDYRIQNAQLIYVNGLPYYKFTGFGRNNRAFIDGFALAVDIAESAIEAQLLEQHAAFCFG